MTRKKKSKTPEQYVFLMGNDGGPWEAVHAVFGLNTEDRKKARRILQDQYPDQEVRLYLYTVVTEALPKTKPYKRIKKLKHVVKSSAEWIKDGERTAVCNVCGTIGPSVPMNNDGNKILAAEGWHKEDNVGGSPALWGFFGPSVPAHTLRCPSCDEQVANKDTREDWFT